MRDHVHERAVAGEERRRQERHARVLHPAVGEGGRQDQHVVAVPVVRAEELLRPRDHRLRLRELVGGGLHRLGLGEDARAGPELPRLEPSDRERQEVGRDRLRHPEAEDARARPRPGPLAGGAGGHHGGERLGHLHLGLVGEAVARGVLQRHQAAGVDGLALAEEEGVPPALRLLGGEPLQRRGVRRGPVAQAHLARPRRQREPQAGAEDRLVGPDLERHARARRRSRPRGPPAPCCRGRGRPRRGARSSSAASPSMRRAAKSTRSRSLRCRARGWAESACEWGSCRAIRPRRRGGSRCRWRDAPRPAPARRR